MNCPNCGATNMVHETKALAYTYKGVTFNIHEVTGYYCAECLEVVLDRDQGDRYSALIGQVQAQVERVIANATSDENSLRQ